MNKIQDSFLRLCYLTHEANSPSAQTTCDLNLVIKRINDPLFTDLFFSERLNRKHLTKKTLQRPSDDFRRLRVSSTDNRFLHSQHSALLTNQPTKSFSTVCCSSVDVFHDAPSSSSVRSLVPAPGPFISFTLPAVFPFSLSDITAFLKPQQQLEDSLLTASYITMSGRTKTTPDLNVADISGHNV